MGIFDWIKSKLHGLRKSTDGDDKDFVEWQPSLGFSIPKTTEGMSGRGGVGRRDYSRKPKWSPFGRRDYSRKPANEIGLGATDGEGPMGRIPDSTDADQYIRQNR